MPATYFTCFEKINTALYFTIALNVSYLQEPLPVWTMEHLKLARRILLVTSRFLANYNLRRIFWRCAAFARSNKERQQTWLSGFPRVPFVIRQQFEIINRTCTLINESIANEDYYWIVGCNHCCIACRNY